MLEFLARLRRSKGTKEKSVPQLDVGSCVGEIFGGAAYATWIYLDHAGLGLKNVALISASNILV
jgi:hypothetical protein